MLGVQAKVKDNVVKYDYCTVVVSQGTKWPYGRFIAEAGTRAFGHEQLGGAAPVAANLG